MSTREKSMSMNYEQGITILLMSFGKIPTLYSITIFAWHNIG